MSENYKVQLSKKISKTIQNLPITIQSILKALFKELSITGPVLNQWPNYGKLKGKKGIYHCHVKIGRPTYVAVWKELTKKIIQILFVGTHEKVDYDSF